MIETHRLETPTAKGSNDQVALKCLHDRETQWPSNKYFQRMQNRTAGLVPLATCFSTRESLQFATIGPLTCNVVQLLCISARDMCFFFLVSYKYFERLKKIVLQLQKYQKGGQIKKERRKKTVDKFESSNLSPRILKPHKN